MNQLHPIFQQALAPFMPKVQAKIRKPKYDQMESQIAGIPCLIEITYFTKVKGDSSTWASDWDYYGYTESEWNVRDRKGYSATWLEKKMTSADSARIEAEIEEFMGEE